MHDLYFCVPIQSLSSPFTFSIFGPSLNLIFQLFQILYLIVQGRLTFLSVKYIPPILWNRTLDMAHVKPSRVYSIGSGLCDHQICSLPVIMLRFLVTVKCKLNF
jgi:hypothetical protein